MSHIIKLETLDIEIPHGGEFVFCDEGYMSVFDLYNKCAKLIRGR